MGSKDCFSGRIVWIFEISLGGRSEGDLWMIGDIKKNRTMVGLEPAVGGFGETILATALQPRVGNVIF